LDLAVPIDSLSIKHKKNWDVKRFSCVDTKTVYGLRGPESS